MYETKALDETTWPAFERLVEANNGVWGGCWCMWYHGKEASETRRRPRNAMRKSASFAKAGRTRR